MSEELGQEGSFFSPSEFGLAMWACGEECRMECEECTMECGGRGARGSRIGSHIGLCVHTIHTHRSMHTMTHITSHHVT